MPVITLTTDFGTRDWFVGTLKGVILRVNPRAVPIDLTHEVPPGDVRAAAFALAAACKFFAPGTVHVAVVDPGVGSSRSAIAVQTRDYYFVGPDNGVLSLALAREKVIAVCRLENRKYFLPVSRTFHGRDIFAPVAAQLSRGLSIKRLGPTTRNYVRLTWPEAEGDRGRLRGEVVYIDRFGNAITNLRLDHAGGVCEVLGSKRVTCPVVDYYQAVPKGRPAAVPGSTGFIEIAVNGGSAAKKLGLRIGSRVVARTGR